MYEDSDDYATPADTIPTGFEQDLIGSLLMDDDVFDNGYGATHKHKFT